MAYNKNKKYYWIKLPINFLDLPEVASLSDKGQVTLIKCIGLVANSDNCILTINWINGKKELNVEDLVNIVKLDINSINELIEVGFLTIGKNEKVYCSYGRKFVGSENEDNRRRREKKIEETIINNDEPIIKKIKEVYNIR